MRKILHIALLISIIISITSCVEPEYGGIIEGRIIDTEGNGIEGAHISFLQHNKVVDNDITDTNGNYKKLLHAGQYTIKYTYGTRSGSLYDEIEIVENESYKYKDIIIEISK